MIIKIKIEEDSFLTFDTSDLPKNSDFNSLLQIIKESGLTSTTQFKIAYAYKDEYDYCLKVLDLINDIGIEEVKQKVEIFRKALNMFHKKDVVCEDINLLKYDSYNILLGYDLVRKGNYKLALKYFNQVKHKLGIELCNYYMNKNYQCTNEILRGLRIFNEKDLMNYKTGREMLRRNLSKEYYEILVARNNENSVDIKEDKNTLLDKSDQINTLTDNIDFILQKIQGDLSLLDLYTLNNDFYFYLKGKREHLNKNYEEAVNFYKKSLSLNYNIYAKYNLVRILQNEILEEEFDIYAYNTFKYFMHFKILSVSNNCKNMDKDIKDYISINIGVKNNLESYINRYKILLDNKYVDKDIIKNNLIYFKYHRKDYKLIRNLQKCLPEYYKEDISELLEIYMRNTENEYVKYNLYYLTGDVQYHNPSNKYSVMIYEYINGKKTDSCQLYNKLKRASQIDSIKIYKECLSSYYAANGIGICLSKMGKYKEGLKIFYSLVIDYKEVYINIGNVYILLGDYERAIIEYIKVIQTGRLNSDLNNDKDINEISKHIKYIKKIILLVYKDVKNIDVLEKVYKIFENQDIKKYIYKLMIESNKLEESMKYKVEDAEIEELYRKKLNEREYMNKQKECVKEEVEKYKKQKKL